MAYLSQDRTVTETRARVPVRRGRALRTVELVAHVGLTWGRYSKNYHRTFGPARAVEAVEAVVSRTTRDGRAVEVERFALSRADVRHLRVELARRGYAALA